MRNYIWPDSCFSAFDYSVKEVKKNKKNIFFADGRLF